MDSLPKPLDQRLPLTHTNSTISPRMLDLARVLVLIGALGIIAFGFLTGLTALGAGLLNQGTDRLVLVTLAVSLLALCLGLGSVLARQAWQSKQRHASSDFRPRMIGFLVLLFLLAVALGQIMLSLDLLPAVTFPFFHVVAAALPSLIILALVGRALPGVTTWRDMLLQLSSGAFVATPLAFALEAIVALGLLMATLVSLVLRPGGTELLQTMATYLQDPTWSQDQASLAPALMSPPILAAIFFVVAGVVPLVEESVKTVGVGLMAYRQPTLSQAFLWGLAGGAGFALVEGLLNTASGIPIWAPVTLLRVGTTLLHCFTGALMGLAWYSVLAKRRWRYGLGLYAASIGAHSLWNALSLGMALVSIGALEADASGGSRPLSSFAIATALALLLVLVLATALGLVSLTLYVRKQSPAPESTHLEHSPSNVDPLPATGSESDP